MKDLLTSAMHEIRDLRHQNEIFRAKVEMIDLFALILHTQPAHRSIGASPDIAWAIQRKLDELAEEEANNAHKGPARRRTDESRDV